MRYYLAHPYDSRKKVREWELGVEKRTGVELHNPFYDVDRKDIQDLDAGGVGRYDQLDPDTLVVRDLGAIRDSDGMVAIVDGALSYGTIMEIVYGHMSCEPCFLIVTNGHEKHPWLVYHSDKIFTSFEAFETFIKKEMQEV